MNSSTMLISLTILILLYPFLLRFQLNSFKEKLELLWKEITQLLEKNTKASSDELKEQIHIKRREYNALVRANNHKLDSKLARFLARKYNFTNRDLFEFENR